MPAAKEQAVSQNLYIVRLYLKTGEVYEWAAREATIPLQTPTPMDQQLAGDIPYGGGGTIGYGG